MPGRRPPPGQTGASGTVGEQAQQLDEGRAVHRGVLADLELGEVEPEGAHEPNDVLQLTVRGAGVPGRDEGVLHQDQVLQASSGPE